MILQKTIIAFLALLLTFQILGLDTGWPLGLTEENDWENLADTPIEQDEETDGEILKLDKIEFYQNFARGEATLISFCQSSSQYDLSVSIPMEPFREMLSPPPNIICFL